MPPPSFSVGYVHPEAHYIHKNTQELLRLRGRIIHVHMIVVHKCGKLDLHANPI